MVETRARGPDRRELNRMLGKLAPGDVVTVTRIDRLARSTFDLFGIVKQIVDARAQFRSLAEPRRSMGRPSAQRKEAIRRAQGATLDELARLYGIKGKTLATDRKTEVQRFTPRADRLDANRQPPSYP